MLKGFKTIIFNAVILMGAVVSVFAPGTEMPTGDNLAACVDGLSAWWVVILAVGNGILRAVTTTPIFSGGES